MMGQGLHPILDGITAEHLDPPTVLKFLREMPGLIGMTTIARPEVFGTPSGLAGFVIIAESSIDVHTYGRRVWTNVFSCKPLDSEKAKAQVIEYLGLLEHHELILARGGRSDSAVLP